MIFAKLPYEGMVDFMINEIHVEKKRSNSVGGKTDYDRLKNMTEEEIEENAKNDPGAPLLSEEELKKFRRVNPGKE